MENAIFDIFGHHCARFRLIGIVALDGPNQEEELS